MVYGFMKQLDGHARLYSEPGKGTRVSLFFPRSAPAVAARTAQHDAVIPTGAGETILVVEDDPDVRLVTVSRLESLGYRVKIAVDGANALDVLARSQDIQLALVDIVMPGGMDGHGLAEEIEKRAPSVRIVLTSGYSPRMAAGGAQTSRPFLPKPASRAQVAQAVHQALRRT
jgi:two-component system CheB/CheR fusion protein